MYGPEWRWRVDSGIVRVVRGGRSDALENGAPATAAERGQWTRHLCRDRLWTRYCTQEDVAHFLSQESAADPKPGLTRAQLERMEDAARGGYKAPLEPILSAQHAVQQEARAKRLAEAKADADALADVREQLKEMGARRTERRTRDELRAMAVAALTDDRETRWHQLWHMSMGELGTELRANAQRLQGQAQEEAALQDLLAGKAVLEPGRLQEDAWWLVSQVRAALKVEEPAASAGSEANSTRALIDALKSLWPRFEKEFKGRHRLLPIVRELEPIEGPCVVDGITVPHPWRSRHLPGEVSFKCYADAKLQGPTCCEAGASECMADFLGYGERDIRAWMKECVKKPATASQASLPSNAQGQLHPCSHAGVVVPFPWGRLSTTPKSDCVAPKRQEARERCCAWDDGNEWCVAHFAAYDAQRMRDWIEGCKQPHWKT